jgi:hypothetical protein
LEPVFYTTLPDLRLLGIFFAINFLIKKPHVIEYRYALYVQSAVASFFLILLLPTPTGPTISIGILIWPFQQALKWASRKICLENQIYKMRMLCQQIVFYLALHIEPVETYLAAATSILLLLFILAPDYIGRYLGGDERRHRRLPPLKKVGVISLLFAILGFTKYPSI